MISEIDTSSVVDETESAKVTTESQMAECSRVDAGSIMAQLDNVWRQQRLSLSTKLRIYTSLVQSVVLHGSETWTMRKVDSDRIQSFHMQALRRILGIR